MKVSIFCFNSNIWGYAWGEDKDEVTGMIYNTITTSGNNLDCTSPSADYKVNCERKLVFGANFANNAAGGTYTAEVQLSLVATPHLVGQAWSNGVDTGIDDMQDIDKVDGGFCRADIPSGSTIMLRDKRGGVENFYKIMKMSDGTCWMVENLRLKSNAKITPEDSDVKSNYTLPDNASVDSSTMNWGTDNDTAYMAEGSPSMKIYNNGPGWKEAYGNYYSWCAATAMSCKENRTGNAIVNTDAAESICPKNWKLPVGTTGVGSFQNLYDKYPNSSTAGWTTGQTISYNGGTSDGYNGLKLGRDSADALFPAAGFVSSIGLETASSDGSYWSRAGGSHSSIAYYLGFYSNDVLPQNSFYYRYDGFSVRCVADEAVWKDTSGNIIETTNLKTMQQVTKENFSDKYCANTSAANALVPIGSTITLQDGRDGNKYKIIKMGDGTCWMAANLKLSAETVITSEDSDVKNNYTLPPNASVNSSTMNWGTNNNKDYMAEGSSNMKKVNSASSGWREGYGNYYSWCAATAMSCLQDGTGDAISNEDAKESICPRGWKLPAQGGNRSFDSIINGLNGFKTGWLTGSGAVDGSNGYKLGYNSNDAFWPAAGYIYDNALNGANFDGRYWSRKAVNSDSAYYLRFNTGQVYPQDGDVRLYGCSVRCVAEPNE